METLSREFWSGCAEGQLRFQVCPDCQHIQYFPRSHCLHCGGERVMWQISKGVGTIYSITQVQRAPTDEFRALAPYAIALVDLAEGVRIMAHANPNLKIGDQARVTFFTHHNFSLPRFEPL